MNAQVGFVSCLKRDREVYENGRSFNPGTHDRQDIV